MKIVDAQVHVWGANTPERPWPARAEPHRAPLGKEELLAEMDKAGVDGVVIVPPSWEGDRNDSPSTPRAAIPTASASWAASIPTRPARARPIAGWKKQKGMLGVRFTFHTEVLRQPLLDGRFDWVWGEMEKARHPGDGAVPSRVHASRRQGGRALSGPAAGARSSRAEERQGRAARPRTSPPSTRCWRSPSGPTWRPRSRRCRATPTTRPIPSVRCIRTSAASSTPSAPSAPSGGPTGRACPAATARASPCSPRRCRG